MTTSTTAVPPVNLSCIGEIQKSAIVSVFVTHVTLVVAVIGILVNALTLIVLRRSTNRGAVTLLLLVLATEDLLIIISYSLYYVAIHYYETYNLLYWLGQVRYIDSPLSFFLNWVKVSEIYTIVLLSFQRYFAIRWPLKKASICSVGRTKRLLLIIITLSGLLKLPNLILGYQVLTFDSHCQKEMLKDVFQDYAWYPDFQLGYTKIMDQVIGFIIPLCALVALNIGLIIRVRQATRQQQHLTVKRRSPEWIHHSTAPSSTNCGNKLVVYHTNDTNNSSSAIKHNNYRWASLKVLQSTNVCEEALNSNRIESMAGMDRKVSKSNLRDTLMRGFQPQHVQRNNNQPKIGSASGQIHSRGVTLTLIGVVTTFIIFEFPTTVCFCIEIWNAISERIQPSLTGISVQPLPSSLYVIMYAVALLCSILNCASNFFIYMLVGSKFRQTFFAIFRQIGIAIAKYCCCCCNRCKRWAHLQTVLGKSYSRRGSSRIIGGGVHKGDEGSDILSNAVVFSRTRVSLVDAAHQQKQPARS